ncbi:hypothetical protein EU538_11245 [Candidatus Thorarchaeota archaeon]|nr:MAG: hypothetical protein EU538_11245 [Candidatus Thorarchaeota archaeon]
MPDDDPRVILGYINQAWTDIRSFISDIWQVSAIGLAVIALCVSTVISNLTSENVLPVGLVIGILVFACFSALLAAYTIEWLRKSIAERIEYISSTELMFHHFMKAEQVPSANGVFGMKQEPLKWLLILFYFSSIVIGGTAITWTAVIVSPFFFAWLQSITFPSIGLLVDIISIFVLLSATLSWMLKAFAQRKRVLDEVESEAATSFNWREFEIEVQHELSELSKKHGFQVEHNVVIRDDEDRIVTAIDSLIQIDEEMIPVEIKMGRHVRVSGVLSTMAVLGARYGIVVGQNVDDEVRNYGRLSVFFFKYGSNFNRVYSWIETEMERGM